MTDKKDEKETFNPSDAIYYGAVLIGMGVGLIIQGLGYDKLVSLGAFFIAGPIIFFVLARLFVWK